MSISQRLDLRQTQSLVMTPQLQQAIKLLQMSNQELCAFVAEEIENNPLLEREQGEAEPYLPVEASGATQEKKDPASKEESTHEEENPYDNYEQEHSAGDYDSSSPMRSLAETVAEKPSLREHLIAQISVDFADAGERMAAAALVEWLDEGGYLPTEMDVVRTQLGLSKDAFEKIVTRLQRLDPAGIFSRSLKECLAVQLREKNRLDPAMAILLDHLDLLAKREKAQLMRLCGVDADDLAEMIAEIRALSPKPALAFTADVAQPIVPDVFLQPLQGGGWHVELNSETLPRVLLNESFHAKLQDGVLSVTDKNYLNERWQQANWLVKALRQRATTILKVASEIVKQQDKFFVYGVQYLKPLILKDIAAQVEMHESTISRVTQNKYIATPRGMFELKYFFSTALATTSGGGSVSSLTVRERIKELIDAEKPAEILSDDFLAAVLRREGIDIARRTVAKYREALKIPSSAQRRREKKE